MFIKGKVLQRKYICIFMAVVLVISAVFVGKITSKAADYRIGTVTASALNVRSGPGTSYSKIGLLSQGQSGEISDEGKATDGIIWYKITVGTLTGWVSSKYITVTTYSTDEDFETYLTKQGFPEDYKVELRKLHALYPNWVFEAQQVNLTWDEVIAAENEFGRSLISKSSISSWKSIENGAYDWTTGTWIGLDGGSWTAASKEIIEYYVDPRNFLDDRYIFQFLKQSYDSTLNYESGLTALFSKSTFWSTPFEENGASKTYVQTLIEAGATAGVSPFTIASTLIQEKGWEPSGILVDGSRGYYNYYNAGAYQEGSMSPSERGIWYAQQTDASTLRPWTTRTLAITGGALNYAKNYIAVGQDTIYLKKFDIVEQGGLYWHQYMTNIQAAASEGKTLADAFWTAETSESTKTSSLKFKIPVYKNMPASACPKPTGDGSPNYMLQALSVEGQSLTPTFSMYDTAYDVIVPYGISEVKVTAQAYDSTGATVTGTGTHKLAVGKNQIDITVKSASGSARTYTINVERQELPTSIPEPNVASSTYKLNQTSKIVTGVKANLSVSDFVKGLSVTNGTAKVVNADGTARSGYVGTGNKVLIYDSASQLKYTYEVILYGDTDGNGQIDIVDFAQVKKRILGKYTMSSIYASAADVDKSGTIDIVDFAQIKKQILGKFTISQ